MTRKARPRRSARLDRRMRPHAPVEIERIPRSAASGIIAAASQRLTLRPACHSSIGWSGGPAVGDFDRGVIAGGKEIAPVIDVAAEAVHVIKTVAVHTRHPRVTTRLLAVFHRLWINSQVSRAPGTCAPDGRSRSAPWQPQKRPLSGPPIAPDRRFGAASRKCRSGTRLTIASKGKHGHQGPVR